MRNIYCIGESIYDIIIRNDFPQAAVAGGSALNTAVSLGRLGMSVHFLTELGNDKVGELITGFLEQNGVNTSYAYRFDDGQTPLALAFINAEGDASYSFYRRPPQQRMMFQFPQVTADDVVLFGSMFALYDETRHPILSFVDYARSQNALVLYDPNMRRSGQYPLEKMQHIFSQNIARAHILRVSHTDLVPVFGVKNARDNYDIAQMQGCSVVAHTSGNAGVALFSPLHDRQYPSRNIQPVSTVGAGDTFNAGIVYSMIKNNIHASNLPHTQPDTWDSIINTAIDCATEVCSSTDNYISHAFAEKIKKRGC